MYNPLVSALRRQIPLLSYGTELNIRQRWHPLRPIIPWYNTRIMNKYIAQQLEDRFVIQTEKESERQREQIDYALHTSYQELTGTNPTIDPASKSLITGQSKIFLFSGHDTTSSSMCYFFYLLSQHPSHLRRLRAEHDVVFTFDIAAAWSLYSRTLILLINLHSLLQCSKQRFAFFLPCVALRLGCLVPPLSLKMENLTQLMGVSCSRFVKRFNVIQPTGHPQTLLSLIDG